MNYFFTRRAMLAICFSLFFVVITQPTQAVITATGDVDPANPATWTLSTYGHIGNTGAGSVAVDGGSDLLSRYGYIGYESGSTGVVTVDGVGSTWTNSEDLTVGSSGSGTLDITGGGVVSNTNGDIGYWSTGEVTVDGADSTWTNSSSLYVGRYGDGTLNITNGGAVNNDLGHIGYSSSSTGEVTVDGVGSTWTSSSTLGIGLGGNGTLTIKNDGLVSVAGTLTIDKYGNGYGFINMAGGGMLALLGDADDSLGDFMDLIDGSDAINYWDCSILDWTDIIGAIRNVDYTLSYMTEGDLAGYTMLTLSPIPEPTTVSLLAIGGLAMIRRRRNG